MKIIGIVMVDHRNDIPDLGTAVESAQRMPQHRLALERAVLLRLAASCAVPATSGDDNGGDPHILSSPAPFRAETYIAPYSKR
jgi:hypothetical protein